MKFSQMYHEKVLWNVYYFEKKKKYIFIKRFLKSKTSKRLNCTIVHFT